MKKIILFIISVGYLPVVLAQGQQEIPAMQLAADSTRHLLYQAGKLTPSFIHLLMPAAYNTARLDYGVIAGKFMAAQDATNDKTFRFNTEGKTVIGKTDLWGSFDYQRTSEDSTHFAHQSRNNTSTPYYFGSPANLSYHRVIYTARAGGQRRFFNEHMPVVASIDYRIGNHFSVNDPRGSIRDYQFNMNAGTGYAWRQKLIATIDGYYGYGAEVVNISYKNTTYSESTVYANYVNYMINGYSEPNPKLSDRNYTTRFRRSGGGVSILYKDKVFGTFALTAKRIKEKQFYYYPSSAGFDTLAYYNITKTELHALWSKNKWAAKFDYNTQKGGDYQINYKANNYQYRSKDYTFRAVYTGRIFNYGLQLNNNSEERLDGVTGNHVSYEHYTIQPNIGWNHANKNKDRWGADLALHYTESIHPSIYTTSINVSYFTHQVIQYNYYYNAATTAGGRFSLQYTKHFKGFYAGLKGTIAYTEAIKESALILDGAMKPGKDRTYGNLAIQFYF
ncbi:MAG: hypothetical protein H6Q26_764 [Bacteroidetes bacterium]|nr:hypothetical protein [Bacteroidota bacterium]